MFPISKTMRLDRFGRQHRMDDRCADTKVFRQTAHTPVRSHRLRRIAAGCCCNAMPDGRIILSLSSAPWLVHQTGEAIGNKSPTPLDDDWFRDFHRFLDL